MNNRYVLITAAKDEESCIGEVIQFVLRQTVLPLAWFIMDDGSSDRTVSIIERFAADHPFIRLQSARARGGRNFGSQYKAIQAAYELAKPMEFDFVAVQDADQAPEREDYYESILGEFQKNPRLGVASGVIYERPRGNWEFRPENSEDAVAASAVFRRKTFDQIGGYTPLYYQGSDWLIQLKVRMASWDLLTRPDLHILHYRPTSSAGGIWRGRFHAGLSDASFGSHPIFEFLKCCRRVTTRPFFFGSVVRYCGYLWWNLSRRKPVIKPEEVAFLRKEQVAKLRRWVCSFDGASVKESEQS
jgi:glycosyltransferase involved in cell wall biosynthesis